MMTTLAMAVLVSAVAVAPPPMTPPPQPDFKQPVNYRAWYDEQVAPGRAVNALDMYGVFLYAPKEDPLHELAPADPVSGQHVSRPGVHAVGDDQHLRRRP